MKSSQIDPRNGSINSNRYFFFFFAVFLAAFLAAFFLATVRPPLKQVHGGDGADTQHSFVRLSIKRLGPQGGAGELSDIPSVAAGLQESQ
jgi:hypothetical protein